MSISEPTTPPSAASPAAQVRNEPFIEAAMAASALVATAEGAAGFAERHKVDAILESLTAFAAFDYRVALLHFEVFAEDIHKRPEEGRSKALQAVAAVADRAEDSRVVLQVARAVAQNGHDYPPARVARIAEIASSLGRKPPTLDGTAPHFCAGPEQAPAERTFCIAVGNQKGGTGKSTTAVHLAIGLLAQGHKVGCIDLDGAQGTFTHYLGNRRAYAEKAGLEVASPPSRCIAPSGGESDEAAAREDRARLNDFFESFAEFDYLIVDTPGNQGRLSRLGHINADLLVTPLNDSFLDIDVLAEIDLEKREVLAPSPYARMVMEQNDERRARGWQPIDWVVLRNRLAQLDTRNSRDMTLLLGQLSERMGFRLLPGLSERMVFRELFYKGLTLFDLPSEPEEARVNPSRANAREEIGRLLAAVTASRQARRTSDMAWFSAGLEAKTAAPTEVAIEEPSPRSADTPAPSPSDDPFRMLQDAMREPDSRP